MPPGVFKSEHWQDFTKCRRTEARVIFLKHSLNHPTSSPTFNNSLPPRKPSLVAQTVKNLPACRRPGFDPLIGKIPWRKEWLPTPVFLPGEFYGQRSLAGYSLWGRKSWTRLRDEVHTYWVISLFSFFVLTLLSFLKCKWRCSTSHFGLATF